MVVRLGGFCQGGLPELFRHWQITRNVWRDGQRSSASCDAEIARGFAAPEGNFACSGKRVPQFVTTLAAWPAKTMRMVRPRSFLRRKFASSGRAEGFAPLDRHRNAMQFFDAPGQTAWPMPDAMAESGDA